MESLSAVQRDMLFILAGTAQPDGQTIREELESYYADPVSDGRLYPNLNQLAENGYIKKSALSRRRVQYELTEKGRLAITARTSWQTGYVADADPPEPPQR